MHARKVDLAVYRAAGALCGLFQAKLEADSGLTAWPPAEGKLWVRYEGGLEAPIDWQPDCYIKCSAAEHIGRDVSERAAAIAKLEDERQAIEEGNRLAALGLAPPAKEKAAGKAKGKKK